MVYYNLDFLKRRDEIASKLETLPKLSTKIVKYAQKKNALCPKDKVEVLFYYCNFSLP